MFLFSKTKILQKEREKTKKNKPDSSEDKSRVDRKQTRNHETSSSESEKSPSVHSKEEGEEEEEDNEKDGKEEKEEENHSSHFESSDESEKDDNQPLILPKKKRKHYLVDNTQEKEKARKPISKRIRRDSLPDSKMKISSESEEVLEESSGEELSLEGFFQNIFIFKNSSFLYRSYL